MTALLVALLSVPVTAPPPAEDEDGPIRFSLPTEDDVAQWRKPGFRLELGLNYGFMGGLDGAPDGRLIGAVVRFGARIDEAWSILGSFNYASASSGGDLEGLEVTGLKADGALSGLRFAGTIDPTWHVFRHLDLAIGLGFAGIVEGGYSRPEVEPGQLENLNASYTLEGADPPVSQCQGGGVAGLVRVASRFVIGPRAATDLSLELAGQYTGCEQKAYEVDLDTGEPIVRRQWWPHLLLHAAWTVAWR